MEKKILSPAQELKKKYILQCMNKELSVLETAMTLACTERTVFQKIADYKQKGDEAFIHGNTGKNYRSEYYKDLRLQVIDIFLNTRINGENPYEDISYNFFTEVLEEFHNVKLSVSFVKNTLNSIGYLSPIIKRGKKNSKTYLLRQRKEHCGELVQADGTDFEWFKDRHLYCIQGFVDDATGYPVGLYMTKNECMLGYIEAFRNMAESFGIPEQLYPDKASVFFVNNQKNNDGEKHLTQFGLMMENFGVDMFPANSPQAKGRIERFWQTIQHRLPTLFKLKGIKTVETANDFLRKDFYNVYKKWFPKNPKSSETKFVKADMHEVNKILKATFPGNTDKGGIFLLKGYKFFCSELPKQKILINLNEKEGLWVTSINDSTKRYIPKLIETDTSGSMPDVMKDLIERIFLRSAKPRFREVYIDVDDVVLSEVKPKKNLPVYAK